MHSIILTVLMLISANAHAYVGPGMGLGILGALLGGIMAVLLAIGGVFWYPIKRLLKKRKTTESVSNEQEAVDHEESKNDDHEQGPGE